MQRTAAGTPVKSLPEDARRQTPGALDEQQVTPRTDVSALTAAVHSGLMAKTGEEAAPVRPKRTVNGKLALTGESPWICTNYLAICIGLRCQV